MNIKWDALAGTAAVSFAITVAVVGVFALGTLALSRREAARATVGGQSGGAAALAGAVACFAACAAVVGYGLYLIAG